MHRLHHLGRGVGGKRSYTKKGYMKPGNRLFSTELSPEEWGSSLLRLLGQLSPKQVSKNNRKSFSCGVRAERLCNKGPATPCSLYNLLALLFASRLPGYIAGGPCHSWSVPANISPFL